jgi:hypothetical protein
MLVPLSEPYEIYNDNKLYLDGLAYLGRRSYNFRFYPHSRRLKAIPTKQKGSKKHGCLLKKFAPPLCE